VVFAETDRTGTATEQTGSGGDIGAGGPLQEGSGPLDDLTVARNAQTTAAMVAHTRYLVETALVRSPQGQGRR
jgi:hypothetical protein